MKKATSLKEAVEIAATAMRAQNVRMARPVDVSEHAATLQVDRSFRVSGGVTARFELDMSEREKPRYKPVVTVGFPSQNDSVTEAAAFLGLVQELVLFAAALQTQLDELYMPVNL